MGRRRGRLTADLLDLVAVALLVPLLGGAVDGAAVRGLAVTSASWAAAAAPAGTEPSGGALPLPWSSGGPTAEAFVDVVATGTLPLASIDLRLEAAGPDDPADVTIAACRGGVWDAATCTGEEEALGALGTTTVVAVALAPGERLALRAAAPRNVANRTTFTLRVEVPRDAVRPGRRTAG